MSRCERGSHPLRRSDTVQQRISVCMTDVNLQTWYYRKRRAIKCVDDATIRLPLSKENAAKHDI